MTQIEIKIPELLLNAKWFIKLRWFAIIFSFLMVYIGEKVLEVKINSKSIYFLLIVLLLINIIYYLLVKLRLNIFIEKYNYKFQLFVNIQVLVDIIFLTAILHFSGGIENPFIAFYIFHIIIASILLPVKDSFLQATFAICFFALLTVAEFRDIIPHYSINDQLSNLFFADHQYLVFALGVFTMASYLVVYITSHVTRKLRMHESELEKANVELDKKDSIKNEYVLRLTHDIKGYVSSIKSCLDVMNMGVYGKVKPEYQSYLKDSIKISNKLVSFINGLLNLTRRRMQGAVDREKINIVSLIKQVKQEIKRYSDKDQLDISLRSTLKDKFIKVSYISIKELLRNIILNAIKYSKENCVIEIEVEDFDSRNVIIKISDNGIGIDNEDIPFLFSELFRGKNARKKYEGTGLGLSIVKQIVLNHYGNIWVDSVLDKGTTFSIKLPVNID